MHIVILTHDLEMENIMLRYLRNAGFRGQRVKTVLEDILHDLHGVYVSSEKSSSTKHWVSSHPKYGYTLNVFLSPRWTS